MKKYILLFFLLLTGFTISAQREYIPKVYIGGKAGAIMSKISFTPEVKQSMQNGGMAGITFRYTEEKHVGLIAEINIEQRGWNEDFEELDLKYSRSLTYIQIPLMTHIYFGGDKFKGFINLGPEVGYLISDNIESDFDYKNPSSVPGLSSSYRETEQLNTEIKNKFDYGISAGIGIEYFFKRKHSINLEGRFYYGLGNIYPDSKRDTFAASRSMSIMMTLGYSFRIK